MIGYKGFDKDFKCRDFQFKVGETYRFAEEIKICECGFHFCDTPLAVFKHYSPNNSRYALVEAVGKIISDNDDEHKFCTDELKILKELTLDELVKEAMNLNDDSAATSTGYCSAATSTGVCSASTSMGDCSAATSTGYCSASSVAGENSIAFVSGRDSKAKGTLGCWLVLTEWNAKKIAEVRAVKVDGEQIKADTFYTLKDGKVIEANDKD